MSIKPEITWQDNIQMCAERLSRSIEERFQIEMQSGNALLPPPIDPKMKINVEAGTEMLDTFIEYLFGTSVAIVTHYVSADDQFEKAIVDLVREKFQCIRDMKKEGTFKPEVVRGSN